MSKTDEISTFTAGSKSCPWIRFIKRKKPWKIVPEKAQTDSWNEMIILFNLLHFMKRLCLLLAVLSKCIASRYIPL